MYFYAVVASVTVYVQQCCGVKSTAGRQARRQAVVARWHTSHTMCAKSGRMMVLATPTAPTAVTMQANGLGWDTPLRPVSASCMLRPVQRTIVWMSVYRQHSRNAPSKLFNFVPSVCTEQAAIKKSTLQSVCCAGDDAVAAALLPSDTAGYTLSADGHSVSLYWSPVKTAESCTPKIK